MNKAGSRTAAGKESDKMASICWAFGPFRSSTVLRFGARRAAIRRIALRSVRGSRASSHGLARAPHKRKTTGRALPVVSEV
jgi:hypothetical protein